MPMLLVTVDLADGLRRVSRLSINRSRASQESLGSEVARMAPHSGSTKARMSAVLRSAAPLRQVCAVTSDRWSAVEASVQ